MYEGDLGVDESVNFLLENGDFVVTGSDKQLIIMAFQTSRGSWNEYPTFGVGFNLVYGAFGQEIGQQISDLKKRLNLFMMDYGILFDYEFTIIDKETADFTFSVLNSDVVADMSFAYNFELGVFTFIESIVDNTNTVVSQPLTKNRYLRRKNG